RTAKTLSSLRRRAGKIRDMDVLTAHAANIKHTHDENYCSVALLEYLGARRLKQARKFHAAVRRHGSKLRNRLKRISKDIEQLLPDSKSGGNVHSPASNANAAAWKLISELAKASRVGRTNLHSYRLKVKELRNLLQMADNGGDEFAKELGELKDAIGEWHDWEELIAIAEEILDHGPKCELTRELKSTRDKKYKNAISLFEGTRNKYLRHFDQRRGTDLPRAIKKPAESVLFATAAIAA
ncbi:MAG TPA: CHAD domain-containing protein, partial [Candidatus Sulfotelmatobacter sp.]|nr:CHAD domain-containing protein [Candidatus Sulfotelmatobacter sp.]